MSDKIHLKGFIKDVRYKAFLGSPLAVYRFDEFDINSAKSSGLINFPAGQIGYSKWVSPKRTRTYPYARLYDIYNVPTRLTIIPILKDEGADGDLDRIQYSTISWMNLLNIYVVFGYYSDAHKNLGELQKGRDKLTGQKLDAALIQAQISEQSSYKQSALHWNRSLMEGRLVEIYRKALDSYARISNLTKVRVHPRAPQEAYLADLERDFQIFKDRSLRGSKGAAAREAHTIHGLEYLSDTSKAIFEIENYLGGLYHLTADQIVFEDGRYIIQECKNSTASFLPSMADIKDGLFKLILFSNLDMLAVNDVQVEFGTRLKLTGSGVRGSLHLPCGEQEMLKFLAANPGFKQRQLLLVHQLNLEASNSRNLEIEIGANR